MRKELLSLTIFLLQSALRQKLAPQQQEDEEEDPAEDVGPRLAEATPATGRTMTVDEVLPGQV